MILTITPNSSLDRVLYIDEFRPGGVMRTSKVVESVGGKGLDASVVLRTLGVETVGLSMVAGTVGQRLVELLEQYGIQHDLVWVQGDTRIAHVIVEELNNRHSHVTTETLVITVKDSDELLRRLRSRLAEADWVIAAGSLPPDSPISYYRRVSETASELGVPMLLDSAGAPILETLPAPPTILKLNRSEFLQTFDVQAMTLDELREEAEEVARRHRLPSLVLTCGEDGILALTPEGSFLATSPKQEEVNAAGAGDAVSAALAWRFSLGDSWSGALRWAAAASAAVVLTEGTADCHMRDMDRILPGTRVQRL